MLKHNLRKSVAIFSGIGTAISWLCDIPQGSFRKRPMHLPHAMASNSR
jgi:hypothetical protein